MLVPATTSGASPSFSSTPNTPRCANPRTPPPPNARPNLRRRRPELAGLGRIPLGRFLRHLGGEPGLLGEIRAPLTLQAPERFAQAAEGRVLAGGLDGFPAVGSGHALALERPDFGIG